MKISQVITALQRIRDEQGDVEVQLMHPDYCDLRMEHWFLKAVGYNAKDGVAVLCEDDTGTAAKALLHMVGVLSGAKEDGL